MAIDPLTAAFEAGKLLIDRVWPNPREQAEELRKLEELYQSGDLEKLKAQTSLMLAQLKVNEAEAAHPSLFIAGWRPFIGWVGGFALAYKYLIHEVLAWLLPLLGSQTIPPTLSHDELTPILLGMLGLGAMRSYDKSMRTDTRRCTHK